MLESLLGFFTGERSAWIGAGLLAYFGPKVKTWWVNKGEAEAKADEAKLKAIAELALTGAEAFLAKAKKAAEADVAVIEAHAAALKAAIDARVLADAAAAAKTAADAAAAKAAAPTPPVA